MHRIDSEFPHVEKAVTSGAASRFTLHNSKPFHLRVYANELEIVSNLYKPDRPAMPIRKKDDIKIFSKSSRLRMMRKLSRVQTRVLGEPIFLSLTMRAHHMPNEEFQLRFQKIFLPRLKEIIPRLASIWRLEPHKSGKPHYHMIVWSFEKERKLKSELYLRAIRKAWRICIRDHSEAAIKYSCKAVALSSKRKAQHYLSKYCAKLETHETSEIRGRRWGASTTLPVSTISEVSLTMNQYNLLKQIVKKILVSKSMEEGLIRALLTGTKPFWVWLEEEELIGVLEELGIPPPFSALSRYRKSGFTVPSHEELELLAELHGHSYNEERSERGISDFEEVRKKGEGAIEEKQEVERKEIVHA